MSKRSWNCPLSKIQSNHRRLDQLGNIDRLKHDRSEHAHGICLSNPNRSRRLQSRQEELQQTTRTEKWSIPEQNGKSAQNREVEQARQALEGKAPHATNRLLANMSHELRTPSIACSLADQLSSNPQGNLTGKQVEFARTIHGSGRDLLKLINDILDLSKIESGTVSVDVGEVRFDEMRQAIERTFRHMADDKGLKFDIEIDPDLPRSIETDAQRLDQILKNLLSNAFKFTERGHVNLHVARVTEGWSEDRALLNRAAGVLAFSVSDSGIGIPSDKQGTIFEAFHQADGSTSRKYGGTGAGSRSS
jgi:signal transduction histidine kinase